MDEWKIPQMLSDKTMNARCVRGQKAPGEVGKGGRGNSAKPWGGQRTARNRGVAQVNGREGRSNGTVEPYGQWEELTFLLCVCGGGVRGVGGPEPCSAPSQA